MKNVNCQKFRCFKFSNFCDVCDFCFCIVCVEVFGMLPKADMSPSVELQQIVCTRCPFDYLCSQRTARF